MNLNMTLFGFELVLTTWKLVGFAGAFMFTGRWFVQMHYSRRAGRPVLPIGYWVMSMAGSVLLLAYFVRGKNDSVGIISNLFPFFVSSYNLFLELAHRRKTNVPAAPIV